MRITEDCFHRYEDAAPDSAFLWRETSRRLERDCRIFDLYSVRRTARDGREGTFVQIDSPDWVTMIPIFTGTDGVERFVMEKQFRHGPSKATVEFPAGLVEKGETPEEAARRELLEETGLVCRRCRVVGRVCPNSAFMNNHSNFFIMEDLELVSGQSLDRNEEIEVLSVPVERALREMGTGAMDNGMMMMALGFYLRDRYVEGRL